MRLMRVDLFTLFLSEIEMISKPVVEECGQGGGCHAEHETKEDVLSSCFQNTNDSMYSCQRK